MRPRLRPQVITPELNEAALGLLRQLLAWQERVRQVDPANYKRKRRLVSGLREVRTRCCCSTLGSLVGRAP